MSSDRGIRSSIYSKQKENKLSKMARTCHVALRMSPILLQESEAESMVMKKNVRGKIGKDVIRFD